MSQSAEAHRAQTPLRRTALRGTQWGQLDGPEGEPSGASSRGRTLASQPEPFGFGPPRFRPRRRIVTWLILPVVICLSQRLSHACLSISNYTVKLRMAH